MSVTMLQSCRAYNVPRGSRLFIRKKKKKKKLKDLKLFAKANTCIINILYQFITFPSLAEQTVLTKRKLLFIHQSTGFYRFNI